MLLRAVFLLTIQWNLGSNMFDCEVQSARKRRLWGKYYTRKCNVNRLFDGQNESLSAAKKTPLPGQGAGACESTLRGEYSTSLVENRVSNSRPDWAKGDTANSNGTHAENVSFLSKLDTFHLSSSNVGGMNDPVSYVLSEGESASKLDVYGVLCTENGQDNELGGSIENAEHKNYQNIEFEVVTENVELPVDHIVVKDDTVKCKNNTQIDLGGIGNEVAHLDHYAIGDCTAEYKCGERTVGGSFENLCTQCKAHIHHGNAMVTDVVLSNLIAIRDDTAECMQQGRMVTESIANLICDNKQQIELDDDVGNVVVQSDHIVVIHDNAQHKHGESMLAESMTTINAQNKTHIEFGDDKFNIAAPSVFIAVKDDTSEYKPQEKAVTGKCLIKDQNLGQEHAIQVEAIPSKAKPDKIQDQSTKFHANSNACRCFTEEYSLVTGKCTGILKHNKDLDDFSLQFPTNCHSNACQLIDHDSQIKRTGPILRSRKICLATSVVKKHQRRIMSSMPFKGGKLKNTTYIGNRLKKNAVKGLLENYLKDWMDKNVQEGRFENEHCLPFLVNAPKRVECFQCKGLVLPGKEVMCTNLNCRQVYHLVCAKQLKGTHWLKKKEFRCSHHVCMVCNSRHGLWRCVRCPVAVHKDCSPWPEAMVFLRERPGPVICWRHHKDWRLEHKSWWIFFHAAAPGLDK